MRSKLGGLIVGLALVSAAPSTLTGQDAQAEKTLIANERAVNAAVIKGDLATFKQYVASDGWAIDMTGRASTAEFLKAFDQMSKDLKVSAWDVTDFHVQWAGPDVAVVTYKWTGKGTFQGQPIPSPTWSSTVWNRRGGKWLAIFHQETGQMEMPAKK